MLLRNRLRFGSVTVFVTFAGYGTMSHCSTTALSFLRCHSSRNPVVATRAKAYAIRTFSLFAAEPSTPGNHGANNDRTTSFSSSSSASSKTYRLDGTGVSGGTKVEATTNTGHSLQTDIPKSMGGGDTAPQPVETFLGAWMGCTQATASFVGRQLLLDRTSNKEAVTPAKTKDGRPHSRRRPPRTEIRLEFDNIQAIRDEKGALELPIRQTPSVASRLQRITGTIRVSLVVPGNDETATLFLEDEELQVLKEQTEFRCPIANMIVASGCAMDVEWIHERTKE